MALGSIPWLTVIALTETGNNDSKFIAIAVVKMYGIGLRPILVVTPMTIGIVTAADTVEFVISDIKHANTAKIAIVPIPPDKFILAITSAITSLAPEPVRICPSARPPAKSRSIPHITSFCAGSHSKSIDLRSAATMMKLIRPVTKKRYAGTSPGIKSA